MRARAIQMTPCERKIALAGQLQTIQRCQLRAVSRCRRHVLYIPGHLRRQGVWHCHVPSKTQQRKIAVAYAHHCIRRCSFWGHSLGHILNQWLLWHWTGNSSAHCWCVTVSYVSCDVILFENVVLKKKIKITIIHMKLKIKAQEHSTLSISVDLDFSRWYTPPVDLNLSAEERGYRLCWTAWSQRSIWFSMPSGRNQGGIRRRFKKFLS